MELAAVAAVMVVALLGTMATGIPVGLGLLIASGLAFYVGEGFEGLRFIGGLPFAKSFSFELAAMPLFVLAGFMLEEAGFVRQLLRAFSVWFAWVPGALAVVSLLTAGGFAAMSGSGTAAAASLGSVVAPEARRYGYSDRLMAGVLNGGASLAPVIPPSIALIIYSSLSDQSIARLFAAGLIPGSIALVLMVAYILALSIWKPHLAPRFLSPSWRDRLSTLWVFPVAMAFVSIILGGILLGWYTPTESAGVAVVAGFGLVLGGNQFRLKPSLAAGWRALSRGANITGVVAFLIIAGHAYSHALTVFGFPQALGSFLQEADVVAWQLMLALVVILFVLGMFVDSITLQVITVPFILPTLVLLDVNLIWFGIFVVLMVEIGTMTPPFGIHVFILQSVMGCSYEDAIIGVLPFVAIWTLLVMLLLIFEPMATWLPGILFR